MYIIQCNAHHHCHGHKTPFCGTGESAAVGSAAANHVPVGQCGKCQVLAAGGGGSSVITRSTEHGPGDGRTAPTSCGNGNICCKTGECAASHDRCSTH